MAAMHVLYVCKGGGGKQNSITPLSLAYRNVFG